MALPKFKARTALATRIARVDRQRFNEAVAEEFYPCAPQTVRGSSRVFDVNDIVALWVYGRLVEEGMIPRKAGAVACELRALLKEYPEADRVVHVLDGFFSTIWLRREDLDPSAEFISGTNIFSAREWFLRFVRERVIHELEEEYNTLGPEDGDE